MSFKRCDRAEADARQLHDLALSGAPQSLAPDAAEPLRTRIVFIWACPEGKERLPIERDLRLLQEAIRRGRHRHLIDIVACPSASITDVRQSLLDHVTDPENVRCIAHFAGHGSEEGFLFVDERGRTQKTNARALCELLKARKVSTAIFAACHSAEVYTELAIPYCIAMEGLAHDGAAREFTRGFYDGVAAGLTIPQAFGEGLSAARTLGLPLEAVLWVEGKLVAGTSTHLRRVRRAAVARNDGAELAQEAPSLASDASPAFSLVLVALRRAAPPAFARRLPAWLGASERDWATESTPALLGRVADPNKALELWELIRQEGVATFLPTASATDGRIQQGPGGVAMTRVQVDGRGIWFGVHPVTEGEYTSLDHAAPEPPRFSRHRAWHPASRLSFDDARRWLERFNAQPGMHGHYRLPTTEEWNQASEDLRQLGSHEFSRVGWLAATRSYEVGRHRPNRWGLLDLVGNVAEWTSSTYAGKHMACGGSYASAPTPALWRGELFAPDVRPDHVGFRLIWEAPK